MSWAREHFLKAVKETKPSVTEEMERDYEKVASRIKQDAARIGFVAGRPA
jgi:transitional endoplasmic reticulum ATPase